MGLILSGAMAGGGAALQQAGMQLSRQWGAEELEKMREDAATARQNALVEANKLSQERGFAEARSVATTAEERKRAPSIAAGKAIRGLIAGAPPDRVISGEEAEGNAGDIVISGKPSDKELSAAAAQAFLDAGGDPAGVSVFRDMFKKNLHTQVEGSQVVDDTGAVVSAAIPKTAAPLAPEQIEYYKEGADLRRAQAASLDRGERARADKPIFPKLIKGDAEGSYWVDQNTNAVGTVVPAEPGKPAEKNWIFPDKPEVKGKPASMTWNVGGEVLSDREYNQRFYGGANRVSGGGNASTREQAQDTGWDPETGAVIKNGKQIGSVDPRSKTARADAEAMLRKGAVAPKPRPSAAPIPTSELFGSPEQPPSSAEGAGQTVDQIRIRLAAAKQKLRSFGVMQRRADPAGFAAAQEEVSALEAKEREAMQKYSGLIGGVSGAGMSPRFFRP